MARSPNKVGRKARGELPPKRVRVGAVRRIVPEQVKLVKETTPLRKANRDTFILLKPGDEKRYHFPKKANQWYQILISATMVNTKTGERVEIGKDTGRYARANYATSKQSATFKFDNMYRQAIRHAYLMVVPPPFNGDPYETDDWWDDDVWEMKGNPHKVYVLIQRDFLATPKGKIRKGKTIVLKEKKAYTKDVLKRRIKKMQAPPKRIRSSEAALKEKVRKAKWNKEHPRKR